MLAEGGVTMGASGAEPGRSCAGCGKPLSRYNTGRRCQGCASGGTKPDPGQSGENSGNLVDGAKLAQLRYERGWTQEMLAEQAGLSAVIVRKLEQNARRSARISTLSAFARALDVPVGVLLGGTPADEQATVIARPAHRVRVREPEQSRPTLLRALIVQRHWQRFQTFEAQFRHAARELAERDHDPDLAKLTVSSRQWERWYAGNVKSEPHPDACRVLEHMFGYAIQQLLAPVSQIVIDDQKDANTLAPAEMLTRYEHSRQPGGTQRGADQDRRVIQALDVIDNDHLGSVADSIGELVDHYAQTICSLPPADVYDELLSVRSYASGIIDRAGLAPRRTDLVLAAGWLSHLLAVAACDMGEHAAARVWCSDAERRSQDARHPELAAWAVLTRAMIAFYQGQSRQSVTLAAQGQEAAPIGTVIHAKLATQEMRAASMTGDVARMTHARRYAARAIAELPSGAKATGAFSIALGEDPPYTATSLLFLGNYSEAVSATYRVIQTVYQPETRQRGENPSGYARSLLILGLAQAGAGRLDEAVAAGHAALAGNRPAWPTMVLAGKLDEVLTRNFADSRETGVYHSRYLETTSRPTGHHLQLPAASEKH